MPVSTRKFSELRLLTSDFLQTGDWARLFDCIGTNDPELAKAISGIFSMYDPRTVFKFIAGYVAKLPAEIRRERRDSVSVACYTLGRIGKYDISKAINSLRTFLSDDHMLKLSVSASLSNLWVLDTKKSERLLFKGWILGAREIDDLQQVAVESSEYLLSKEPELVRSYMKKIERLDEEKFRVAKEAAHRLLSIHPLVLPKTAGRHRAKKRRARK